MLISDLDQNNSVLFYDGYCYLCSNTIRLFIHLDRKKKLRFMSLQKGMETADIKKLVSQFDIDKSIILLSEGEIYTKSNAIIKVIQTLGGGFKLIGLFYILPLSFRDFLYDLIAKNRYRLFGKRAKCHLPKAEFTDRYL